MRLLETARMKLLRRSSSNASAPPNSSTPLSSLHLRRRERNCDHNKAESVAALSPRLVAKDGGIVQTSSQAQDFGIGTAEELTIRPATTKTSKASQSSVGSSATSSKLPLSPLSNRPLLSQSTPDIPLDQEQATVPQVTVREPTPANAVEAIDRPSSELPNIDKGTALPPAITSPKRPSIGIRRQSLVPASQHRLIKALIGSTNANEKGDAAPRQASFDFNSESTFSLQANMVYRKVWVKRPGQSATLVTISEEDLVDDVREAILRKYANSLGHSYDAPDLTLHIIPRTGSQHSRSLNGERVLGPEEPITRTLDAYYPGGQAVDEALLVDVPQRRTPRPSPRVQQAVPYYVDDSRPGDTGDYFPLMPASPHPTLSLPHSMTIVNTGQLPPLPSPGGKASRKRPAYNRQRTNSPTILSAHPVQNNAQQHSSHSSHSRMNSFHSETKTTVTGPPLALPTPPAVPQPVDGQSTHPVPNPPPARTSSPRPARRRQLPTRRSKHSSLAERPSLPAGLLDGSVPPINVLIVEDNPINLRLLEAFMKRLKVRWQTAMNGRDAVKKWRSGGFHLVLMDIQLPIMNGLQATKEIRRLERLNNIGVFSSSASSSAPNGTLDGSVPDMDEEAQGDDILQNRYNFKSPVIIVALTASSLQSDRHEALAAGCNDFLTKPVNFVWLERKVMEWGCMQALIDFDGWRKWKDFSTPVMSSSLPSKDMDNSMSANTITAAGKDTKSSLANGTSQPNIIRSMSSGAATITGANIASVSGRAHDAGVASAGQTTPSASGTDKHMMALRRRRQSLSLSSGSGSNSASGSTN